MLSLIRIVLLITIHSCNILTHPLKLELPNYNGLFNNEDVKAKTLNSKLLAKDLPKTPKAPQNKLPNQAPQPGCANERLLLPLKYRFDDRLADRGRDNRLNEINLPNVKQPYQNYKVLVAAAPAGLQLDEDNKPMSVYIVFNDENNYASPLDLPTVYFVKKPKQRNSKKKDSVFLVDNNRTVTGLRSKEIQKFVKFRNKFTSRFHRHSDDVDELEELDETSEPTTSATSTVTNNN